MLCENELVHVTTVIREETEQPKSNVNEGHFGETGLIKRRGEKEEVLIFSIVLTTRDVYDPHLLREEEHHP